MKIGILTFHASHNYGSMLQAFALQHFLNTHGHEAETINLRSKAQCGMYPFPLLPRHRQLNDYLVSFSHPVKLVQSCRNWLRYESFLKETVRLTPKVYKDWEDIQRDLSFLGYECLITGGDQIWNMRCRDFDKSYYLPSKTPGIRKVSYAPSFGDSFLSTITPAQASFMKDCLSDYSFLSVREPSMQQYLSKLLGWEPTVTVDPTLLLQA